MSSSTSEPVVFLDTDVAEELLDLVKDEPGLADEDLLEDALASFEEAKDHLPGPEQQMIASGEAVAFSVVSEDAEAVKTLITENEEVGPRRLKSVAGTIRSKLRAARKKARRR